VETYPLWECPNKEAALRELLEMNSTTFWNQIVVEDQDQMTDSQDLKEQAVIGATDSKTGHDDDLRDWVSTLNDASEVVKDDDLALFPQLEHSDESMQLTQRFLDEFVNVNSGTDTQHANDDSDVTNFSKDAVPDNFDIPFVSKLDKSGLDEEVTAAAQLLTTEDEQIAEELISYLVHEEVIEESVNSPTSSLCTVDDIPDSNTVNNRSKRKRSNTTNDEDNVAKKIKRRIKNNEASKVTRAKRRNRHQELFETERKLADSNNELRMKLEVMQREADILRQLLVVTLSNANSK